MAGRTVKFVWAATLAVAILAFASSPRQVQAVTSGRVVPSPIVSQASPPCVSGGSSPGSFGLICNLTVNTTADTHDATPGDQICADAQGNCSLRAAVEEANALGGLTIQNGSAAAPAGANACGNGVDQSGIGGGILNCPGAALYLNGATVSSSDVVTGSIYAPSAVATVTGNSGLLQLNSSLIVSTLTLAGDGAISIGR